MYELSRNRFKELKHFCLQYPNYKKELFKLENQLYLNEEDPTGNLAVKITEYRNAIKLIETTAFNLGKFPGEKILRIVCYDECLGEVCPIYIRKFFWLLSEAKGV